MDIDGGEDSAFDELTIEVNLHVPRSLELLEDNVVHSRSRVNEGSADNGQTAPLFDVACGAEEPLGFL